MSKISLAQVMSDSILFSCIPFHSRPLAAAGVLCMCCMSNAVQALCFDHGTSASLQASSAADASQVVFGSQPCLVAAANLLATFGRHFKEFKLQEFLI